MSPQEWLATQQTAPAASAPLSPEQWLATQKPATNAAEGPPSAAVPFVPVSRKIMDQGERMRNRLPVTPAPVVAPTVAQPADEPTEKEMADAKSPATVNPIIARQGEKRRERLEKLAPTPPVVKTTLPPVPYKNRQEALDDAVNLLDENVDPKRVSEHFSTFGITEEDITRHGRERGSQYFAPQEIPTGLPEKFIPSGAPATIRETPDELGIPIAGINLTPDDVARSFKRAGANLRDMSTSLLFSAGVVNPDEAAGLIRQNARARLAAATSESTQAGLIAIGNAKTYGDAVQAMYDNPAAMWSMMADSVLTSLPALAPSLLLGPAGWAARGAAAFVGSGGSEYASVMTDVLQDKNIDLRDADKVARALKDPKILAEIKEKGAARGLIVGTFDGLTMGLAGRFINPARSLIASGELSGVAARKATMAAFGKELAMQVAGGAGGEFAAQKATGENKPAAVLLEGVLEGVTGQLEVRSALKAPSKQEILGRALNDEINNRNFTEAGSNQEALARLNPDQAQYTSTAAPARRPQAPQGTVTAAPIAPAVVAAEPKTEAVQVVPAAGEVAPSIEEQRAVPKGLLTPKDFESPAVDDLEDPSVTPVTLEESSEESKAPREEPPLTGFVARGKAAMDSFESSVMEQFGLTQEQARAALGKLISEKIVKINPLTGSFDLKDGRFWDKEVMLRAAGVKPEDKAEAVEESKTAEPDDLYNKAVEIVRTTDRASPSLVQRQLNTSFDEAIALIEKMERNGVVSPADASGSRTVIETTPAATTAARQTLAEVTVKGRGLIIDGPAKVDAPTESLPMEEQDLLRNMVDSEIRNGVAKGRTNEEILQRIESLTKGGIKTSRLRTVVLPTIEDARKAFKAEAVEESKAPAAPKEVAETVEKKTGPDEESGPFVQHKIEDLPTVYPLVSKLKMSKDVPQFKYGANEEGVVEPLGGTFDTTGVAPIQVWVRRNGDLEVISGRHRLDLAKRSGRVTIPAQYHYEANGFDKERAAILDAELNIRDQQGKVKDYVNYFKGAKLSREEADSRGLLARDNGKRGYTIANEGGEELIAAHRGDAIGDEAAYLIAKNAPQDGRLQSVGIKAIQDGKSMSTAINTMQAVRALAGESQTSVDMFGFDDSAMKEADEMAKIAARKQREISQRLSAITGAAKNPALAKAEGIDIKDPAAVKKRIEELRQLKTSWDNWSTNPDLVGEIRQERGPKPLPFTLTGETEAEIRKRERKVKEAKAAEEKAEAEVEAKEKKERDKKAIAEASKKSDFTLTPSEDVGKEEQAEIDKKKAEQELSGQSDMLNEEEKTTKTEEREPVKGDRFKDGKGNEFEIWSSRQGSILAHPVVNGKAVVNRESLQLWAIGDLARARFPERRTDYFPIDATKPTEATAKTEESDNKKVEAALEKLNDKDVEKLETHYKEKKGTDGFATKLRADIQLAIEKGINAVAKGIRNVISKLLATILAVGVAFNPVTFNAESQAFNIPSIQKTELVKIVEKPKANFGAITPSVTTARLAHYVVGTNDNEGLPFIITDKPIATSYVFDAKGNLVAAAPVLLGAAKYADVIPSSAIEKTVSQTTKEEKVTPAGRFKGKIEPYKLGTSFDFIKLGNSSLAGHIVDTSSPTENRPKRLSTPTVDDNFISYGCINYGDKFYKSYIEKQFVSGGIQYITPMSQTLEQTFEGIAGYQPTTTIVTSIVSNPQSAFNVSKHSEQGVPRSPRTNVTLPSRRRREGRPDSAETNLIGNKRLSEQPADVREALAAGFRGTTDDAVLWQDMFLNLVDEDVTGKELLDVMSNRNDERQADPVELSMAISALYSIGLDGIIDEGGSRTSFIPKEYDLKKESDVTDNLAAENPAESKALNEMDQLPTAKKKLPPGRSPELAAAAQMVKDGTMTTAQFDSLVNKYKPIYIFTDPLVPATIEKMVDALTLTQSKQVNPKILDGTAVGLRLDIPSFNRKGVHVVSIHEKGTKSGSGRIIGYSSSAKAINVKFGLGNQNAALNIAAGEAKKPLQTIEGSYVSATPEQIYAQAKLALIDPAWTQIGLNPTRHSYFYDRRTTVPVVAADEVLQIGNMVLGKNVTFGKKEDFLFNIDSQPPLTAGELAQRNTDIRREQINEYAGLRRRMASAVGKVAKGEVSTDLQRRLQSLISRSKELKNAIDISTPTKTSQETFLAKALSEYDAGNISADVLAVVQDAYNKYPQLLDGIRLSVKSHGKGSNSRASAMFVPLARIVRLFKSTTGATDPKSIRHELNHSLEQMMSGAQRQVVFDAWLKDLQKASEKNKDEAHQNFFNAVINFIENPTVANHEKAMAAMPSYEMYQYVNPSEYWAVNAEKLMASQLGTAWQRFKLFVKRMFEGLKSVFGFDNKYAVHRVFNQIMSGEMNRISHNQLVDMVTGDKDFAALNNRQDDMDLLERYGHAHTPTSGTSSLKKAVLAATTKAKQIYKQGVEDPKSLAIDTITYADRATIYLRNKNVWYGTGLDAAEYSHFKGQMRDTNGMVNASIALDNAIRATAISSQVVLNGGIKYDPNSLNYVAEKRDKGMVGVYKAESIIKKKLGNQLGTDIIQGYLEAKRSLSIRNELVARKDQIDQLTADLITLKSNPNVDPDDIKALKMEIAAAKKGLAAIEMVERKVSMSNGEIRDFLARARAHPELSDIMTNFNATNQNLLVFWRDVGLISDARYELLSNIKDYIPWYRIMEDGTISADTDEAGSALQSTTRSMTNIGKEKLFKAGRPSVSTRFTAKQGQQTFKIQPSRVVGVEINENPVNPNDVQSSPNGEVTINVPINEGDIVEFKTNREIQNMIDNMTRSVMRMTMNGLRKHASNAIVKRYATRNQNGQIKVFPKADKNLGLFNYVANGRNIVVEIEDKLIAEAIFGMENIDIKMLWGFNAVANFTRRLITIDPAFQFRQLIQDMPMAAWASGTKHWYKLLGGVLKDFVYTLVRPLANKVGVTLTGNQNFDIEPVVRTLQLAGVGGYHIPSRTAEKEVKMQIGIMNQNVYQFILKALDHIGDASDVAPRIATYKQVLAETGDEALALYRAANVINFQHRGSGQIAQILVKTVPFTSAYANATDVLAQTLAGGGLKGKSRKAAIAQMAITGTSLGIITLLIRCAIGDDDEYKKYDDKTRYGNYLIPGTDIMLPMHNSGAFFFKVLPEFLYDKYIEESTNTPKDKTRLKEALKTAAIDMLLGPTPVPSAARPSIEIGLDHSFVTGRTVVPAGLKGVEAAEQYTATTSELGKYISSVTRDTLNPIQADHIIRGMFGSVGALSQWASNMIGEAAEKRPAPTAKQNPFYGAFLKPVQRGPEDLFYDFKERVEKKYKTMQLQIDRQDVKGVISNVEENKRLIAMHDYVTNTNEELGKLNKIIREISEGKMNPMSPQEKRKTIELLQRAKNSTLTGVENMRSISGL